MGQKEVKNENCCGVFEMRDLARFFSEVLNMEYTMQNCLTILKIKFKRVSPRSY